MRLAVAFTQFHADCRLLDVEGGRPDGDEHEVGDGDPRLDQVNPSRCRVNEHPLPAFADEELDGFGRCIYFEQLGVLGAPAACPPAGQAFLRVEIEQSDALALFCGSYGKGTGKRGLAGSTFYGGQRNDAQSLRLLESHLVPTPLPGRGPPRRDVELVPAIGT